MDLKSVGKFAKGIGVTTIGGVSIKEKNKEAIDNKVQSVYYDCQNYMANIIRCGNQISLRYLYLFYERIAEDYLDTPCDTWDATYKNLPVVDTLLWKEDGKDNKGLILDEQGCPFMIEKSADQTLAVKWDEKYVIFSENEIRINHLNKLIYDFTGNTAQIHLIDNIITFHYKKNDYKIIIYGAKIEKTEFGCIIEAIEDEIIIRYL